MPLTFVTGSASDVFSPELASAIDAELKGRYSLPAPEPGEAYRSDEVDARGWSALQQRVPGLAGIDAYQAVFVPATVRSVDEVAIANLADPLHVSSLDTLMAALRQFAAQASLPTDDVELMALAARYLEDDELMDQDLDLQTYVQLMLTVKQAAAHRQPLWLVS